MIIYHLTTAGDWETGQAAGEYTTSTRGRTLAGEGFIHASTAGQVTPVANTFYQGVPEDLVVLVIDTDLLASPVRHDKVPGWDEPFPHIYGPVNPAAVVAVVPLEAGPDGKYAFTSPARGG